MKKIDKETKNQLIKDCVDYIYKNNNSNMRERYVFFMPDSTFVFVEGNTNAWYIDDCIDGFSQAHSFVNAT